MAKEKTVNDWLDEFRGYTYKQKIIEQASKQLLEAKTKALGYTPTINEVALVTITNPLTNEILGMGGSTPNDLVLDQFGTWLAGMIRAVADQDTTISLKGDDGVTETVRTFALGNNTTDTFNKDHTGAIASGTKIKVGSGVTAPARANFQLETAFGTAPESGYFNTGVGSYAAGSINCSGSITAGGAGSINETILATAWLNSAGAQKTFALFRDAISPAKAFVAAQLINVAYTINL